ALQADGRILVAGALGGKIDVVRLDTRGEPDLTFGKAGLAMLDSRATQAGLTSLVVAHNGLIVGGGWVCSGSCRRTSSLFFRLAADGSPDAAFGSRGIDVVSISTTGD